MKTYSAYRLADGIFTGKKLLGGITAPTPEFLARNTPKDCALIEGDHDRLTKRVDVETGTVVDYVSPLVEQRRRDNEQRKARAELDDIDRRLVRYLADIAAGELDDEGERRLREMRARKRELRESFNAQ